MQQTGEPAPHRVLVLSADMGGGHNATAAALEESVGRVWPGSEIRRLDSLDVMGPGVGRLFRSIYVSNVETTPWMYEFFYANLWRHRWFSRASKRFTGSWCGRRLQTQIDRFDPDLVLSTYPLGSSGLAWLKDHRGLQVPAAAWVSDFAPHPFWVYEQLDATFVMHEAAVAVAKAAEPEAHVEVSAPPVVARFAPGDRTEARERLGLRQDALVVAVSCGAYAFGDTEAQVTTLVQASDAVQVVAVCGRQQETVHRLERLGLPRDALVPVGWTDDMPLLLRAADLVLTNAGGATALEALAVGVPVVTAQPIAAHGAANADLMEVARLTHLCSGLDELSSLVASLAARREGLDTLRQRTGEHVANHDLDTSVRRLREAAAARPRPPVPSRPWPMRPADAFFTRCETDVRLQEVGAVLELEPEAGGQTPDAAALRRFFAPRTAGLPPTRRTRSTAAAGWLLHDDVDLVRHVQETVLAADAPAADLWQVMGRLWSEPLRAGRPAWAMQLARRRPPAGPRSPVLLGVKLHHSQGDGISALGLMDRLLDVRPGDPLTERRPPTRELQGRFRPWLLTRGLASLAARGTAPHHPLNAGALGMGRDVVGVPLPWDRLRRMAGASAVRPHEVVIALLADAADRLLRPAGLLDPGRPLRAMVPVAMRAPRLDRIFGNWAGSVAIDLPMGPMTFPERVRRVHQELLTRTARGDAHAASAVMTAAGRVPHLWHRWFARTVYSSTFFNTIVSFMPAARGPRWLAGARVRALYPVLPLTKGVPLTFGIVVFDGVAGVGIMLDTRLGLRRGDVESAVRRAFDDAQAVLG